MVTQKPNAVKAAGSGGLEVAKKAALGGGGLCLAIVAYYWLYTTWGIAFSCLFYQITHWYCPGCGVTRMLFALLKGEFYQAFRYNPLAFALLPAALGLFIEWLIARAQKRTPWVNRIPNAWWVAVIVIVLIYGVMRNLPWFSFLAPIEI